MRVRCSGEWCTRRKVVKGNMILPYTQGVSREEDQRHPLLQQKSWWGFNHNLLTKQILHTWKMYAASHTEKKKNTHDNRHIRPNWGPFFNHVGGGDETETWSALWRGAASFNCSRNPFHDQIPVSNGSLPENPQTTSVPLQEMCLEILCMSKLAGNACGYCRIYLFFEITYFELNITAAVCCLCCDESISNTSIMYLGRKLKKVIKILRLCLEAFVLIFYKTSGKAVYTVVIVFFC